MGHAISVRLDKDSELALRALEASGMSRSEAIRASLIDAAKLLRDRSSRAAEVAALETDEGGRAKCWRSRI